MYTHTCYNHVIITVFFENLIAVVTSRLYCSICLSFFCYFSYQTTLPCIAITKKSANSINLYYLALNGAKFIQLADGLKSTNSKIYMYCAIVSQQC